MVLGLVSSAFGTDYDWTNDYPWSYLWSSPWNWDPVTPPGGPGPGDRALIRGGSGIGPVVDGNATAFRIDGPEDLAGDATMYVVKDANLVVGQIWRIDGTGDSTATLNFADNAKLTILGNDDDRSMRLDGVIVMNVTDSTDITMPCDFTIANDDDDYFELNMDSGSMRTGSCNDGFRSNSGAHNINISGDAVLSVKYLRLRQQDAYGEFNISGDGQVFCDEDFRIVGGEADGEMNLSDNALLDVEGDFRLGEDNDWKTPSIATLNMSGGLIDVAGNCEIVGDGDSTGFAIVNLTGGVINVEDELVHDTDQYVMNICGDGQIIVSGDIVDEIRAQEMDGHWFACPAPSCHDGEIDSQLNLMVDYNEVSDKTTIWAGGDNRDAWAPRPKNGETDVPSLGTLLCWCAGEWDGFSPDMHHVFFSDDESAVADESAFLGTVSSPDPCCIDPGPLQLGATYYWKVNEQYGPTIVVGNIWNFTVEFCRVEESMEEYAYNPNLIYETWKDGCGYWVDGSLISNGTGSCVNLGMAENHSGAKAMVYTYENVADGLWDRDHNYSEAWRDFDPPLDLTLTGEATMVLYFYGDPDNGSTDMWVKVDGVKHLYGTYSDDPEDIKKPEWIDWNIALADLAAGSADLTNVTRLSIGFGDDATDVPDDAVGTVLFDDISVCPVRCIPKYVTEIFDLNDDCITDWLDVKIQADNWLEDRTEYEQP
jgi:hypothetical protein